MTTSVGRRRVILALALLSAFNFGFFARPFIDELRRPDALALLAATARIEQPGVETAPRIYVAFDPYCDYCHALYAALAQHVEAGELQVDWVPVAFMDSNSATIAAQLLTAADPGGALSRWFGASPRSSPFVPQGANASDAQQRVRDNTQLVQRLVGRAAAPAVFYRDREGVTQLTIGVPADLERWIDALAS